MPSRPSELQTADSSGHPVRSRVWGEVLVVEVHQPVLSVEVLGALALELDRARSGRLPLVLCSGHERIFLAGAHLAEIAELDRHSSAGYARFGREVLARLLRHPSPTVAAVTGSCTGGGLDLVLHCDRVVASETARFGHPGVRRGIVTGWGGTVRLPDLDRLAASRAFLEGALVGARAAAARGLVAISGSPLADARAEALRLARLHPLRLLLWRHRGASNLVDRWRYLVVDKKMVQHAEEGGRFDGHQDLARG